MTMCPTYTFIDRANGKFNSNMSFKREYSALISAAWEIDKVYDNYLSNPEAETSPENILGVSTEYRKEALENFIISYRNVIKSATFFSDVPETAVRLAKMFGIQHAHAETLDFLADLIEDMKEDAKSSKKKKKD